MKNFDKPIIVEKLKHIRVVYIPQLESIKLMVQEHYDTPEYDDSLILINRIYHYDENGNTVLFKKDDFTEHRRIFYNFEHGPDMPLLDKENLQEFARNFGLTEMWTFEPNIEQIDGGLPVKYRPPRYTTLIEKSDLNCEKKFDLGFVGIIGSNGYSPRRNDFFNEYIVNKTIDFSIKILNGFSISQLKDELANCKFILDSKRNYRHSYQNNVRIFEHLCLGHTVLSEKSDYNIFPGLIYEWNNIHDLNKLIKNIEPEDFSEKYKELTYSDEAYERYCTNILLSNFHAPITEYFYGKYNNRWKRWDVMNALIRKFNFKTYLEIGVYKGENFKEIVCENKTSVDPIDYGYTTYHMTSDEYFAQLPEDVKFDLIFIDGLHHWEYCYRDINNSLKHLSPNGIIVCHDMNPLFEMCNSRLMDNSCGYWNGDVWKAFVKIRTERDDVSTMMIEDCDMGLGVIYYGTPMKIQVSKPAENLYYQDFVVNKKKLMNCIQLNDFISQNNLQ